jgi:AraC family transcriptional regulator
LIKTDIFSTVRAHVCCRRSALGYRYRGTFSRKDLCGIEEMDGNGFAEQIRQSFRTETAPWVGASTVRGTRLTLVELKGNPPQPFESSPISDENAFLVILHLQAHSNHQIRVGGTLCRPQQIQAGQTTIVNLKQGISFLIDRPYHCLCLFLPRSTLEEVSDIAEAPAVRELTFEPGVGLGDETLRNLIGLLGLAFMQNSKMEKSFIDHVALAIVTHIALAYGGLVPESRPIKGALAPWQEKKALEMLHNHIASGISVSKLARACELSDRHFCRAFRQSLGSSPHTYIQTIRIEMAKQYLTDNGMTLANVGAACGFADQSHFTRVFAQLVGLAPGVWRRKAKLDRADGGLAIGVDDPEKCRLSLGLS